MSRYIMQKLLFRFPIDERFIHCIIILWNLPKADAV